MFRTLTAKNFLSWRTLSFSLSKGITLLEGYNYDDNTEEGCGKSAILNAICWGLYGKIPKSIKADDIISFGEHSVAVEIELLDGSTIIRQKGPNKLVLKYSNGVCVEKSDVRETQKFIDSHIGIDFDSFCFTVYFSQSSQDRFLVTTPETKSKILTKILDLSIYDNARSKCKDLASQIKKEVNDIEYRILSAKAILSKSIDEKKFLSSMLLEKTQSLPDIQKSIDLYIKRRGLIQEELLKEKQVKPSNYKDLLQEAEKANQQALISLHVQLSNKMNIQKERDYNIDRLLRVRYEIKKLEEKINSFSSLNLHRCPSCGQAVSKDKEHVLSIEKKLLIKNLEKSKSEESAINITLQSLVVPDTAELEKKIKERSDKLKDIKKSIATFNTNENKIGALTAEIESIGKFIEHTKAGKETLKKEADKIKSKIADIDKEVSEKEAEINRLDSSRTALEDKYNQYNLLIDAFKEIKLYIYSNALQTLNNNINVYLEELFDAPTELRLTNTDDSGGISKIDAEALYNGKICSIANFSGGQQKRLQLAVDLAISDLLAERTKRSYNLLIFDEVFSKDLSFTSQQKVLKLLEKLDKSILLVDHSELFKGIINQRLYIELANGISSFK